MTACNALQCHSDERKDRRKETASAMTRCYTDCIVRPIRRCFEMMGAFIGSHPWWFLITPLILSAGLGSGFYFLKDCLSNDIEEQFTPVDGQAKVERKYIQDTFLGSNSTFSGLRLTTAGNYATVIASNDKNILTQESLDDLLELDFKIRSMAVHIDQETFEYVDVCAQVMGSCSSNDILDIIRHNSSNIDSVNLTFPWYHTGFRDVPLHLRLGSVQLNRKNSIVERAKAIQLHYYLKEDSKRETDLWLESFIKLVSNTSASSIQVN